MRFWPRDGDGRKGQTGYNLSHQTTKFPPTPSNHSTSPSHVRIIKLQYCTLTVIQFRATILYDSAPLHAPAFLLFTMQSPPLKHLSPRTRRKRRKPFPLRRLLHNSRTPRGWGATVFLRELCARRLLRPGRGVKTNPRLRPCPYL
jgi:hypothetical protein